MSAKRIAAVRTLLKRANLDGAVITHLDHIRYLCGYTGTNGLLVITSRSAQFFTDFRYTEQAKKQVTGAKCEITSGGDLIGHLAKLPALQTLHARYAVMSEEMTVAQRKRLAEALPNALLVDAPYIVSELGWVKEAGEVALIAKAAGIADTALSRVLGLVRPGVRERELAAELEYQMAMLGSEKPAFESIVASGYRSAMPHGIASDKKVKKGDFVTFDFGATVGGYVSDTTRTVVVGKATKRQKRIYDIVLRAQTAAIKRIKAGVEAKKVDAAARNVITRAGFGKNFGHGTGHGIGFYIHVGPWLSGRSDHVLKVNHVITVEPGIYITGWGGVRIEDDVVVTRTGARVLNRAEKKLLEVG